MLRRRFQTGPNEISQRFGRTRLRPTNGYQAPFGPDDFACLCDTASRPTHFVAKSDYHPVGFALETGYRS